MFLIKNMIFIFCLSCSTISLSQEECKRDLTLEKAKVKVEEYKELYNRANSYKYNTRLEHTNGECHYYYYESVNKRDLHLNRFYYLAEDGEVLFMGSHRVPRPGTIKCPAMKLDKKYFFNKVQSHVSVNDRKVSFIKSNKITLQCMYLYSAEFEDKLIPSLINYTFDYKGRVIEWAPTNEAWLKEEKEFERKLKEKRRIKRENAELDKK